MSTEEKVGLTDEEIEAIDIHCGMSEIDGSEPFIRYKYEHHLNKAQIKKVVEFIGKRRNGCQLNDEEVECRLCLSELLKALLEEVKE